MMPPHHLTQNLFSQLSVRQHSRYPSPSGQPQPRMWHPIPGWVQAVWIRATDVRQWAFGFLRSCCKMWLIVQLSSGVAGLGMDLKNKNRNKKNQLNLLFHLLIIHFRLSLCQLFGRRCRGIIWLMTAEFPYLITNRISAPLELLGEESDEWQGRTRWPERGRGRRQRSK